MKCTHCKKTHAVLVSCKCDKQFCLKHRLPEQHLCTYITPLFQIEQKIVKEKIIKI
jgi:hypothetical protein